MVSTARRKAKTGTGTTSGGTIAMGNGQGSGSGSGYEEFRDQRIKENKERMQKLGILDLSLKLKTQLGPFKRSPRNVSSSEKKPHNPLPLPGSPRRSSRLKSLTPVNYSDMPTKTKRKSSRNLEIQLREGSQPEIYTEEHEKLLGDCKRPWTLFVDGYGKDGKRIYDQERGETCHQCRQKTLGCRTHCIKCNMVQGQFCGDCLYMRYGENVIEVNENPDWICPVCRGICNCSFCRHAKGWTPTGSLYRKVTKLGFKSVAHYLIQARRSQGHLENSDGYSLGSEEGALPSVNEGSQHSIQNEFLNADDEDHDGLPDPEPNDYEGEIEEEEKQVYFYDNSKHVGIVNGYDVNTIGDESALKDNEANDVNVGVQEANDSR